jgi:hypothetical protein
MFDIIVVNSLKFGNEVMLNSKNWKKGDENLVHNQFKALKNTIKFNFVVKLNSNQYNTIYDLRLV